MSCYNFKNNSNYISFHIKKSIFDLTTKFKQIILWTLYERQFQILSIEVINYWIGTLDFSKYSIKFS